MLTQDFIAELQPLFLGAERREAGPLGNLVRRRYLDSAATSLMLKEAYSSGEKFLEEAGSSHSSVHLGARLAHHTFAEGIRTVLKFLKASPEDYACLFVGQGATSSSNRLARILASRREEKPVVFISHMEHHSFDLPFRRIADVVERIPYRLMPSGHMAVDFEAAQTLFQKYQNRVNVLAVTGVSNVNGAMNPIHELASLAHAHGALIAVDAAQMISKVPIAMRQEPDHAVDALVFSGHKLYAPGSPGVLVIRKDLLLGAEPVDVGGGMVEDVDEWELVLHKDLSAREHAGTPNLLGIHTLTRAIRFLETIGMEKIFRKERELYDYGYQRISALSDLTLYSPLANGIGALAFNIKGLGHEKLAAALHEIFRIAVRNGCFCAHPFVKSLLWDEWMTDESLETMNIGDFRGMVRASFGLYSQRDDLDALHDALALIVDYRKLIDDGLVMDGPRFELRLETLQPLLDDPRYRLRFGEHV